jgi:hypothetical protein
MSLHLLIGNKNYSSWSFRPWLAMRVAGISFDETVISVDAPISKRGRPSWAAPDVSRCSATATTRVGIAGDLGISRRKVSRRRIVARAPR